MRLVITSCPRCGQVTEAHHANTLDDLEKVGEFIREMRARQCGLHLIQYNDTGGALAWCQCSESTTSQTNKQMQSG